MPTAVFPLSYLQRFSDLSADRLVQLAFDYGLNARLGQDGLGQESVEVEVTAERPDLLSASGLRRALNDFSGQDRKLPEALEPSGRRIHIQAGVLPLRPYLAALVVEQVLMSYVQINSMDGKEATTAATNVQVAELRMRRHEAASKRHLKSLELLSKLRTIPLPVVAVENLTVVQAKAEEAEPDQTILIGQKVHNRLEHAFE